MAHSGNSAAHTVVIKGVKLFRDGVMKEYTDLEIMQMIGRAVSIVCPSFTRFLIFMKGRPQFGRFYSIIHRHGDDTVWDRQGGTCDNNL